MQEILLADDVKPALEWINNRVVQKVSPRRRHSYAQGQFVSALTLWAHERGNGSAGTEWHFQVQPPGEISRTLVPDAAFLSYERMPIEEQYATEIARIAPDVVVEVHSPGDKRRDIEEKVRVYLAAGTSVIFLVDPQTKTVTARDRQGSTTFSNQDVLTHPSMPGFSLPAPMLFDLPQPK